MIRLITFLLLIITSTVSWAQNDLVLSGGVINSANDFQVGHENWARVKFTLENSSKKSRAVKIQFKHASAPEAVYEYELVIPAQSKMNHQFPVAMGSAAHLAKKNTQKQPKKNKKKINRVDSTYKLTLMEKVGDRYLPVKGSAPLECVMDFRDVSRKPAVALFTDETVEIGNLSRKLGYGDSHFRMTYVHKGKWAEHWSEYSAFDALVFLDPVFDDNHPLLLTAIKDYLKMGGTVIFAHHNGIINAANSQFEEILPVIPLKTRQINRLPELQKYLKSEEIYSEFGMTFVDTVAKDNSFIPCSAGEMPVIVWKKVGLGLVGVINISPTQSAFHKNNSFAKAWKNLFAPIQRPADISMLATNDAKESVNMLNGLTIPGPSVILNYMIVYIVLIVIIFCVLVKCKKSIFAWGAALVVSVIMTALIFKHAYASGEGSKNRTAAVFSQIPVVNNGPTVQVYSVFSKSNDELDFNADIVEDRFRKLPKVKKTQISFTQTQKGSYKTAQIQEVITGNYNADKATLKGLKIQGLSARTFTKISRNHMSAAAPAYISFGNDGLSIDSKEFPSELSQAENIFVCGQNGIIPLQLTDNILLPKANPAPQGKAEEYLRKLLTSLKFRSPTLCYSVKGNTNSNILNDTFEVNGMNVYMVPLIEKIAGEIFLPGEFTRLNGSSSATYLYRDGIWGEVRHMGSKATEYKFNIALPLAYENLNVNELIIDFAYINQSGNILVDVSHAGQKAEKSADGIYRIKVDPKKIKQGIIEVDLIANVKVKLTDNLEIHKANLWKVKHLKVGVKGTFDKQHKELRF